MRYPLFILTFLIGIAAGCAEILPQPQARLDDPYAVAATLRTHVDSLPDETRWRLAGAFKAVVDAEPASVADAGAYLTLALAAAETGLKDHPQMRDAYAAAVNKAYGNDKQSVTTSAVPALAVMLTASQLLCPEAYVPATQGPTLYTTDTRYPASPDLLQLDY